ncbi:MAG: GLPGLI family protein [Bacteroidales bacterium]
MKQFVFILVVALGSYTCFAQDRHRELNQKEPIDTCIMSVGYDFHFVQDTIRKEPRCDRQILEIGRLYTRYFSAYGEKIDSLYASYDETDRTFAPNKWKTGKEQELYEDFYTNYPRAGLLTVSTGLIKYEYVYTEPIPLFKWNVNFFDTRKISGYLCHKATTLFRGRDYEVWYTTEVPVPFGPWKLNGLPGLILEATTMDGLFSWKFVGIEQPHQRKIYIYSDQKTKGAYPMRFVNISRAAMRKLQQKRWEDPIGLTLAHGLEQAIIGVLNPKTGKITYYDKPGTYQKPYMPTLELE